MSCKYCNLKRRKDGDVEWIAGEEWKSESDDGGYICPHDNGFRMLVYYDARCACTAVDDIKYCPFCGAELTIPAEPLIKDEKIRKAVRAWADANDKRVFEVQVCYQSYGDGSWSLRDTTNEEDCGLAFIGEIPEGLNLGSRYAIAQLCGEEEE